MFNNVKTPHVHAKSIKAWADGTEIEFLDEEGVWKKIATPSWKVNIVYRVKPVPDLIK